MSLTVLRERRDLCRELQRLTNDQRQSIAVQDYDALIELLAEKRSVVERLLASTPLVHRWATEREGFLAQDRSEGERLLAESKRLLNETAKSEEIAIAELTDQRNSTQRELSEIASSGQVNVAYRDSLAPATYRSLNVTQ